MNHQPVIPLLKSSSTVAGATTSVQTAGNIIVSVVGTGVLGLPFAFRVAGWLPGSIGVIIAGISTYCCMLKLVECRNKLSEVEERESSSKITYGDLGYETLGPMGRFATESLILIAQCGGSVAYLVFIGQSLCSIFGDHGLSFASYMLLLVPIQIALSWIQTLSALAPFSIFADVCNAIAMAIVLKDDLRFASAAERRMIAPNAGGLPFAGGVAVFCFEGFGMTLALEASMRERAAFPRIVAVTFAGITIAYVLFGLFGYMAYGDQTKDIVTLNLPDDWSTVAVQIGLCLGLVFTLPIMLHPIHEIVEGKMKGERCFQKPHDGEGLDRWVGARRLGIYVIRALLVIGLAVLATCVPSFGVFASLVGSTVCALISFVLPAFFHLTLLGSSLRFRERALDYLFLCGGLLFAAYGTYNAICGVPGDLQ